MKAYYQQRAAVYDQVYQKPERQEDLRRLEELIPSLFEGENVFEIGCGTGYWTEKIALAASMVHAIDQSAEMLALARGRCSNLGNVSFHQKDMFHLSGDSGAWDALFAGFIWSHIPVERLQAFLSTMKAFVKKGGKMVFVDNFFVKGSSTPISRKDVQGNTFQIRTLPDDTSFEIMKNFPEKPELIRTARQAGLEPQFFSLDYYWVLVCNIPV